MKTKRFQILIPILVLLSIGSVLALIPITREVCDGDNLIVIKEFNLTEDASTTVFNISSVKICNWGCDNVTESCNQNPIREDITILVIVIIIAVILFVVIPKITR